MAEVKRGGPLKRKTPLKQGTGLKSGGPLRRTPLKATHKRRLPAPEVWRASKGKRCAVCGRRSALTLHHVAYEQHVRRWGGDPWDRRDGLTVCLGDHARHHDGSDWKIPVAKLRKENLVFVLELMDGYAADYLAKHYAGTREEIEARLRAV